MDSQNATFDAFTHFHSFKILNINLSSIELQIEMFGFKDQL